VASEEAEKTRRRRGKLRGPLASTPGGIFSPYPLSFVIVSGVNAFEAITKFNWLSYFENLTTTTAPMRAVVTVKREHLSN